jgi:hypothetical protein
MASTGPMINLQDLTHVTAFNENLRLSGHKIIRGKSAFFHGDDRKRTNANWAVHALRLHGLIGEDGISERSSAGPFCRLKLSAQLIRPT